MKLASHYLQEIAGVEIYPLISFVLFFVFFMLVLIWVFSADKGYMDKMAAYAIEPDDIKNDDENIKLANIN